VNCPFICDRYSRTCASYHGFLDKWLQLARKLLNQEFLMVKLKSSFRKFYGIHHDLVNLYGIYVSTNVPGYDPFVVITIRSFLHSWLMCLTWSRSWLPFWSTCFHPGFSTVRVPNIIVCPFSFDHWISSIYGFWLPFWYLQSFLHMECLWYDIQELVVPVIIFLIEEATKPRFQCVEIKSLGKFYGRHHDLVNRYRISVSQMTTESDRLS
jgi:hypothetical protein